MTFIIESNIETLLVRAEDFATITSAYIEDKLDFKVYTISKSDLDKIVELNSCGTLSDEDIIESYFDLNLD